MANQISAWPAKPKALFLALETTNQCMYTVTVLHYSCYCYTCGPVVQPDCVLCFSSTLLHATCPPAGILLLYQGSYHEPAAPRRSQAQSDPPSLPISRLYSGGNYPKGMEMPYTVIPEDSIVPCNNLRYAYLCSYPQQLFQRNFIKLSFSLKQLLRVGTRIRISQDDY